MPLRNYTHTHFRHCVFNDNGARGSFIQRAATDRNGLALRVRLRLRVTVSIRVRVMVGSGLRLL